MDITSIAGVGPKTASLLEKLNIFTVGDLITYYPFRYNVYNFNALDNTDNVLIVKAVVESRPMLFYIKKNFNKLSFRAMIEGKIVSVVIFNRGFIKINLDIGKEITLIGKYDIKKNVFTCSDIKFNVHEGDIEPVYHLVNGLKNSILIKAVSDALNKGNVKDLIPKEINEKYKFKDKLSCIKILHKPRNVQELINAKKRLIYEELFEFSFKMCFLNEQNNIMGTKKFFLEEDIQNFINALPFKLTEDQLKCAKEMIADLASEKQMNRLLLGDVGSGKTVVAAISVYASFKAGFQSALMAPTEILAIQHYYGIKKFLDKFGVTTSLITGSMSKREKKSIYNMVLEGHVDLLIGTHAILNENAQFKNLGLVITDEQHRFGVNQRSNLQNKTLRPDILYLSATPIPRTYALTIFGNLDISMIKSKPVGRKEIVTKVKKEKEIKDVLYAMLEQIKLGHQIYIIASLVNESEELDLNSVYSLKDNIDTAFQNKIRCEVIHGKMKQNEKDAIMNDFKNNQIKILISTTVIEVGIDVPNATMIVIYNAERFGLATLHQLRGRVGRSELQSYCFLISNSDNERLKIMEESNDGFYISKKDFEMRGHGDLFGTRQSGDMHFKLSDLKNDYPILLRAKTDAEEYIKCKAYLNDDYYNSLAETLNITD